LSGQITARIKRIFCRDGVGSDHPQAGKAASYVLDFKGKTAAVPLKLMISQQEYGNSSVRHSPATGGEGQFPTIST
jgi:hypothetical protein